MMKAYDNLLGDLRHDEDRFSTDMTAIVGIKYRGGIIVKADSLSIRVEEVDAKHVRVKKLERLRKVIEIAPHVVMGISCNSLANESFRIFVMFMKANLARFPIAVTVAELAQEVKYNLEAMNAAQPDLCMAVLLAGYDKAADGTASNPQLYRVELNGTVTICQDGNYSAVGAKSITDAEVNHAKTQGFDIERLVLDRDIAMEVADRLLRYCSKVDAAYIEDGEKISWHVGGQIKQWNITPSGVAYVKGGKNLKVRIREEDVLTLA